MLEVQLPRERLWTGGSRGSCASANDHVPRLSPTVRRGGPAQNSAHLGRLGNEFGRFTPEFAEHTRQPSARAEFHGCHQPTGLSKCAALSVGDVPAAMPGQPQPSDQGLERAGCLPKMRGAAGEEFPAVPPLGLSSVPPALAAAGEDPGGHDVAPLQTLLDGGEVLAQVGPDDPGKLVH